MPVSSPDSTTARCAPSSAKSCPSPKPSTPTKKSSSPAPPEKSSSFLSVVFEPTARCGKALPRIKFVPSSFPGGIMPYNQNSLILKQRNSGGHRNRSHRAHIPLALGWSRGAKPHQPLLAQDYGPYVPRRLPRQCLRPRHDDSLLHRPYGPRAFLPSSRFGCLRPRRLSSKF